MKINIILAIVLSIAVGANSMAATKKKKASMAGSFGGGRGFQQTASAVRTVVAKNQIITDFVYTWHERYGIQIKRSSNEGLCHGITNSSTSLW